MIQYFAGLTDLSYVISPYNVDTQTEDPQDLRERYHQVLHAMESMNVKTQLAKIVTVCLLEDTFYGTTWTADDNITIQQLPADRCTISSIEGNVLNVSFDFSYFDQKKDLLPFYPAEFNKKYKKYKKDGKKWVELDSPTSFAIKCSNEILDYPIPPFAGILREVYDLEDYKQMKLSKTALENYAMLVMKLGITDDGDWQIDYNKAVDFYKNLNAVLPEEIGAVLSPMDIEKIGFERSHAGDIDTISDAEQGLFSAAGVSSLLFNNSKASANALALSIKADQSITFGIVKSIEDAVNRYIQAQPYGANFKATFLDCSPYNRKEVGDMYLKACQYGLPFISMYAASQGLSQGEVDCMNFLENDVLGLTASFVPLQSSATQSSEDSNGATDEGGAPEKDVGDITESGEQNQEDS